MIAGILLMVWCFAVLALSEWLTAQVRRGRAFTPRERLRVIALSVGLAPWGFILSKFLR